MKKLLTFMLVSLLGLLLVSCGKKDVKDPTKEPTKEPTVEETTKVPVITEEEPTKEPLPTVVPKPNATTVTFCSWDINTEEANTITRRLINRFNQTHDDIQIKIIMPEGDYDTFLTTMASGRKLPDLFMTNSVPTAVIKNLAGDITEVVKDDQEWNTIVPALRDSITYKGHVYGIPVAQHYLGFYANYKLIDDYLTGGMFADEVFAPGVFSHEDFFETVKNINSINVNNGTGKIGINATGDMINWLPSVLDKTGKTKHFVWDEEKLEFGYTSEVMYDALNTITELGDKNALYTFESVMAKDYEKGVEIFGTDSPFDAFRNGQVGFIQSGTWENFTDNDALNYSFVAYPDNTVISASDYMCVSRASKHKEAAYEVAKYLSFGVEGTNARFDIIDENPKAKLTVMGLPIVNNQEISDRWFTYVKLKGVKEVYDLVNNGEMTVLVEGIKSIPGFQEARFKASTGLSYPDVRGGAVLNMSDFIWDVCSGAIPVSTYISDMNSSLASKINSNVKDAYAEIERIIQRDSK